MFSPITFVKTHTQMLSGIILKRA